MGKCEGECGGRDKKIHDGATRVDTAFTRYLRSRARAKAKGEGNGKFKGKGKGKGEGKGEGKG